MKKSHHGFTIVELLIAIVVIGILAAITIVAYSGIQGRAKDAQTDSDISSIRKMLDMYYLDNGTYPALCAGGDNAGCNANLLAGALIPSYGSKLPEAYPEPTTAGIFGYVRGTGGNAYAIYLRYETKPDCKKGVNVAAGWWGAELPTC